LLRADVAVLLLQLVVVELAARWTAAALRPVTRDLPDTITIIITASPATTHYSYANLTEFGN